MHSVDEGMDKETHCSADKQWPKSVPFRAMHFVMEAHNSLDPCELDFSQQDAMNSNATLELKSSPC